MLSKALISNSIIPHFTTHPRQHSHLLYIYFVHMLLLNWPIFCSIVHSWSNRCPTKSPLQSYWHFLCDEYMRHFLSWDFNQECDGWVFIHHHPLTFLSCKGRIFDDHSLDADPALIHAKIYPPYCLPYIQRGLTKGERVQNFDRQISCVTRNYTFHTLVHIHKRNL